MNTFQIPTAISGVTTVYSANAAAISGVVPDISFDGTEDLFGYINQTNPGHYGIHVQLYDGDTANGLWDLRGNSTGNSTVDLDGSTGKQTVLFGDGDDSIFGGAGEIDASGNGGEDDFWFGAKGGSAHGGLGDDTFFIAHNGFIDAAGSGIEISGGDGKDTLNLWNADLVRAYQIDNMEGKFDLRAADGWKVIEGTMDSIEVLKLPDIDGATVVGGDHAEVFHLQGDAKVYGNAGADEFNVKSGGVHEILTGAGPDVVNIRYLGEGDSVDVDGQWHKLTVNMADVDAGDVSIVGTSEHDIVRFNTGSEAIGLGDGAVVELFGRGDMSYTTGDGAESLILTPELSGTTFLNLQGVISEEGFEINLDSLLGGVVTETADNEITVTGENAETGADVTAVYAFNDTYSDGGATAAAVVDALVVDAAA